MHEGFEISWEALRAGPNDAKRKDGAMAGANVWPERPEGYMEAMLKY
jgi:isopenicillin N synthase-like dioxygenase